MNIKWWWIVWGSHSWGDNEIQELCGELWSCTFFTMHNCLSVCLRIIFACVCALCEGFLWWEAGVLLMFWTKWFSVDSFAECSRTFWKCTETVHLVVNLETIPCSHWITACLCVCVQLEGFSFFQTTVCQWVSLWGAPWVVWAGWVLTNGILHGMLPTKYCPVQSVSLLHAHQLSCGELLYIVLHRTSWLLNSSGLYGECLLEPMLQLMDCQLCWGSLVGAHRGIDSCVMWRVNLWVAH